MTKTMLGGLLTWLCGLLMLLAILASIPTTNAASAAVEAGATQSDTHPTSGSLPAKKS